MRRTAVASGLVFTVACLGIVFGAPASALAARCAGSGAPPPRLANGLLSGVAASSACDVWAVGYYQIGLAVEHWNGETWNVQKRPSLDFLPHGVAAVSARDVWTVGYLNNERCSSCPNRLRTRIGHWNGKAWKVQKFRPAGILTGVAAVSARDVWAVGSSSFTNYGSGTLIERCNGKAWKVQPSPKVGGLNAVTATSATNAWAVGGGAILHWNGKSWKVQTTPSPLPGASLNSVAAVSARDVWAVGVYSKGTLIEHWNGKAWRVQKTPGSTSGYVSLDGVAATSQTNAWAVGNFFNYATGEGQGTIEHWNGKTWKIQPSPQPGRRSITQLFGVAAVSSTGAWAVGNTFNTRTGVGPSVTEHWNGKVWK